MDEKSDSNVPDLIKIATSLSTGTNTATAAALLGADLVVVALAWDNPPSEGGIISITFLMMISFVAFISVLHQIMRWEFIISRLRVNKMEEKERKQNYREFYQISKWIRPLHISGLLFTMIAFWIISYKYLISIAGYHVLILCLPFTLFILYWIPKIIGIEREISFFARENITQFFIQIIFLVLICLDFFRLITIP
jgi:hypothetical protein